MGNNQNRYVPTQIPNLKVKQASAGVFQTAILDLENNIRTFRFNNYGQLDLGDIENIYVPTQIHNIKAEKISAGEHNIIIIGSLVI